MPDSSSKLSDESISQAWQMARRSLRDLRLPHGFAASDATGLYHAVFGRDSLWMGMALLEAEAMVESAEFTAWVQDAVGDSLRILARNQGSVVNDQVEEQPGKIIHELHTQPTAHAVASGLAFDHLGRSFAGFDQTFLFITTVYRFTARFPDDPLVVELWPHVRRAVSWIVSSADEDQDGLYEYTRRGSSNLVHQTWKDSFDAITHVGFDIPPAPIAWIDVQGYAFRALQDAAEMHDARGLTDEAATLRGRAVLLAERVNELFIVEPEGYLAVALDGAKRQVRMVTSNAGHALWSGVVEPGIAARTIARLTQEDMATEYGIRTLAATSPFYAPFAYHRGSIWPHDNAVVAAGFLRYGETGQAHQVMEAVVSAILSIGSAIELYIALDLDSAVSARSADRRALHTRNGNRQNQVQGFSAAALLVFAATLARLRGIDVENGQ